METEDLTVTARLAVQKAINDLRLSWNDANDSGLWYRLVEFEELKVVWFAKVLTNWKALIYVGNRYYEITYSGITGDTYIDTYVKERNQLIRNGEMFGGNRIGGE